MKRSFRNHPRRKTCPHAYDLLEHKHLLAGITINGTAGDDFMTIEYIRKGNMVNITLNGELTENVDISDGLFIDLGQGQDTVIIDSSMGMLNPTTHVEIQNVYELQMLTGNNIWRVHDAAFENGAGEIEGGMFGSINDSIFFADAKRLVGGDKLDRFNIHSFNDGTLLGGEGDDVFRFGRGELGRFDTVVLGQGGNDYFVVHGDRITDLDGGDGVDRLLFQSSEMDHLALEFNAGATPTWSVAGGTIVVESIRGLTDGLNEVSYSQVNSTDNVNEIQWVMSGRLTQATIAETGQVMNLIDFYSFERTSDTTDRFYIRETASAVSISGATFIQFSSTMNPENGNLDGIRHLVTINPDSNLGAIRYPHVVISNQAGQGSNYVFETDNRITGLTGGGTIWFDIGEFRARGTMPIIAFYGSDTETDRFVFKASWADTSVYGMGGDDTFMLGGPDVSDSTATRLRAPIQIFGGDGEDRMIVNDQGSRQPDLSGQAVREYRITDQTFAALTHTDAGTTVAESSMVRFDDSTEIVRINGSANVENHFIVEPNSANRFVVHATHQTRFPDSLRIIGIPEPGTVINADGDDGVWLLDGYEPIFFYGVEDVLPIAPVQTVVIFPLS